MRVGRPAGRSAGRQPLAQWLKEALGCTADKLLISVRCEWVDWIAFCVFTGMGSQVPTQYYPAYSSLSMAAMAAAQQSAIQGQVCVCFCVWQNRMLLSFSPLCACALHNLTCSRLLSLFSTLVVLEAAHSFLLFLRAAPMNNVACAANRRFFFCFSM